MKSIYIKIICIIGIMTLSGFRCKKDPAIASGKSRIIVNCICFLGLHLEIEAFGGLYDKVPTAKQYLDCNFSNRLIFNVPVPPNTYYMTYNMENPIETVKFSKAGETKEIWFGQVYIP